MRSCDQLELWHCHVGGRPAASFWLGYADRCTRPALVDVLVYPAGTCGGGAHGVVAESLSRWPGLALVAVGCGDDLCVLGAPGGATVTIAGPPVGLVAALGYLWILAGSRLDQLRSVVCVQSREALPDLLEIGSTDWTAQAECLDEIPARGGQFAVVLGDVAERKQYVGLIYGRPGGL